MRSSSFVAASPSDADASESVDCTAARLPEMPPDSPDTSSMVAPSPSITAVDCVMTSPIDDDSASSCGLSVVR